MLNWIWLALILASVIWAGFSGRMDEVQLALFEGAKSAVTLVIGLVGTMVFMLGLMQVAFDGGLRAWIGRALAPLLRRIFPDIPPDHPAMSALVMNMASNMLGLGNAATPFGIKAMVEMNRLNPHPGVATDAMVLFLAINTSAITLMPPNGTVAVRAAAGSVEPMAIWPTTLIATACSTTAAVLVFYLLRRLPVFAPRPLDHPPPVEPLVLVPELETEVDTIAPHQPLGLGRWIVIAGTLGALAIALFLQAGQLIGEVGMGEAAKQLATQWLFPVLVVVLLLIGVAGRVPIYDSMIKGAREGLDVAVRITPYMVAIIAAVAMLRASGLINLLITVLDPITRAVGVPAEVLPMALLRPLSASGAFGIMSETLEVNGPDSFIGNLTSTLMGSTETTFYVLAVYFGAARITETRHTLFACLTGDVAGFVGAVAACHLFFG